MTFVIGEKCLGERYATCVDVCPVDCIYSKKGDNQLFINPEECIDCAACEPVCPVNAIYPEEEVPKKETASIDLNKKYDYDNSEPGLNT